MKTILSILALSLLLATTTSCTAYHRHPVATVASLAVIGASTVGICAGIGDCGGEYGDRWQNNFARYGGTQLSVIAIIVASGVIAWADGDTWPDDSLPCPAIGKAKHDCTAPDGHVWSAHDWNTPAQMIKP